eukprot:gene18070-23717_t
MSEESSTVQENTNNKSNQNQQQEFSVDLLRVYYDRLFPYNEMYDWFSYGNNSMSPALNSVIDKSFFHCREWSFTIENDVYIRYQCFQGLDEFRDSIRKHQPHKIDIGAVFNALPKDHTTIKPELFKPIQRELVFDIDMTDYDTIRTCCEGANICNRCWPFMTMAVKILDQSLREDFGFQHILWIYSGRRGVHCWVCDKSARYLNNEARSAIVDYLTIDTSFADSLLSSKSYENSDKHIKNSFTGSLHPLMRRSYETLESYFERYIADEKGQGLLVSKDNCIKILNTLPSDPIRKSLYDRWERSFDGTVKISGAEKWRHIVSETSNVTKKNKKENAQEIENWRIKLVLSFCYPRLDANVSKAINHLLKSPFCVHPKTGRVCIPIDPENADTFNPFSVPTIRNLCAEIDSYDNNILNSNDTINDTSKTSLKSAISYFESNFMKKLRTSIRVEFKDLLERKNAIKVEF